MSSGGASETGHLDASGDREVVYCHQCDHEWYRDSHGLICPNCDGEATEIVSPSRIKPDSEMEMTVLTHPSQVTPDNDPRNMDDILPGFGQPHIHHAHGSDDDPDEEDIENHLLNGHPMLFGRRTIYRNPQGPGDGNRDRTQPGDVNAIMSSFQELLEGIGGRPPVGRSGPEQLFPPRTRDAGPAHVHYTRFSGPGNSTGGITTFTFSTGGGGARTTVRSGSPMGAMGGMNQNDPFQSYVLVRSASRACLLTCQQGIRKSSWFARSTSSRWTWSQCAWHAAGGWRRPTAWPSHELSAATIL